MRLKTYLFLIIILSSIENVFCKNVQFEKLFTKANELIFRNPDSARIEILKAKKLVLNTNLNNEICRSYIVEATTYTNISKYNIALSLLDTANLYAIKANDKKLEAAILNNRGIIYVELGSYNLAAETQLKNLMLSEKINNKENMAFALGNLGQVYSNMKEYHLAKKYYTQALNLNENLKRERGIGVCLINLGIIHFSLSNFDSAIYYYGKAEISFKKSNSSDGLVSILSNKGDLYLSENNLEKALENYKLTEKLYLEMKDFHSLTSSQTSIAEIYFKRKDYINAYKYVMQAYNLAVELKTLAQQVSSVLLLSKILNATNKPQEAYKYLYQYTMLNDSLFNVEKQKDISKRDLEYQFSKRLMADSIKFIEQEKSRDLKIASQQVLIKHEKSLKTTLYIGIFLLLCFLGFVYNRYLYSNSQKKIIQLQSVESNKQKKIVEQKNFEIVESINYARHLQEAILPPKKLWENYLADSFILFKPKDIVAGDFYWMEILKPNPDSNETIVFAAADCTGHGVPGAMVSVVCSNALNRAVKEFHLSLPSKILDKVKELVIETFEKSENKVNDGMDISLISLQYKTENNSKVAELNWSGANNPLWIIKENKNLNSDKNTFELIEYKPDKQPIGYTDSPKPFTNHCVQLNKGDCLYLFTDGYADQFGGPDGKKLKYKPLKEMILSIQKYPMDMQKELLENCFNDWTGALEQVDDVCIIGVRV